MTKYWHSFKEMIQKVIYSWLVLSPNAFLTYALTLWKQIKDIKPGVSVPFRIYLGTSAQVKSYRMWLGGQIKCLAGEFTCFSRDKFKTQVKLSIVELAVPFGLTESNPSCSPISCFLPIYIYHIYI